VLRSASLMISYLHSLRRSPECLHCDVTWIYRLRRRHLQRAVDDIARTCPIPFWFERSRWSVPSVLLIQLAAKLVAV
jgi:hypothetical protein